MSIYNEEEDASILDFGIHEAEVNSAIDKKQEEELDVSKLPIEVDIKNIDQVPNEEFAKLRRDGFGGSDSGVLLGISPYKNIQELILQKATPYLTEEEKNIGNLTAVRKGNDLEPLIIEKFAEAMGLETIKPPHMYRFKESPHLKMNFDGVVKRKDGGYAPAEIKVITIKGLRHYNFHKAIFSEIRNKVEQKVVFKEAPENLAISNMTILEKAKHYGIPPYYYTQLQQEMMALNSDYGYLAALSDHNWRLHIFFVHADPKVQELLKAKSQITWQQVEKKREETKFYQAFSIKGESDEANKKDTSKTSVDDKQQSNPFNIKK